MGAMSYFGLVLPVDYLTGTYSDTVGLNLWAESI